eukprot:3279030-Amphidinium_carterae.1
MSCESLNLPEAPKPQLISNGLKLGPVGVNWSKEPFCAEGNDNSDCRLQWILGSLAQGSMAWSDRHLATSAPWMH